MEHPRKSTTGGTTAVILLLLLLLDWRTTHIFLQLKQTAYCSLSVKRLPGARFTAVFTDTCYFDFSGMGNWSIFFTPIAEYVGKTFTFGIVEDTGSNLTWNVSFSETLAYLRGSPDIETKQV